MKQYVITPAAGKRLIGKAVAIHPAVKQALKSGTLVIIAGTTNGYAAEEILNSIGDTEDFDSRRFFRGITLAPSGPARGGRSRRKAAGRNNRRSFVRFVKKSNKYDSLTLCVGPISIFHHEEHEG